MKSNDPAAPDARQTRRIFVILVTALTVWALFLAVGATGVFTDFGLFDIRRSLIVLACSAVFLGFWWAVVRFGGPSESNAKLNWASITSLGLSLTAYAAWLLAHIVWREGAGARATTIIGWLSFALFGASGIMALIGASDPRPKRGKLLALLTLLLLFVAGALFFWQVRRYQ